MRTDDNRHVLDDKQTSALAVALGDTLGSRTFSTAYIADHLVVLLCIDGNDDDLTGRSELDYRTYGPAVSRGSAYSILAFARRPVPLAFPDGATGDYLLDIGDHQIVIGHFFLSVDRHNEPTAGYSFSEYPCDPVEHWCSP